jgi:hypothetical protein
MQFVHGFYKVFIWDLWTVAEFTDDGWFLIGDERSWESTAFQIIDDNQITFNRNLEVIKLPNGNK